MMLKMVYIGSYSYLGMIRRCGVVGGRRRCVTWSKEWDVKRLSLF